MFFLKEQNSKILYVKQTYLLALCPLAFGKFEAHGCILDLLKKHPKKWITVNEKKEITTSLYVIGTANVFGSLRGLVKNVVQGSKNKNKNEVLSTCC